MNRNSHKDRLLRDAVAKITTVLLSACLISALLLIPVGAEEADLEELADPSVELFEAEWEDAEANPAEELIVPEEEILEIIFSEETEEDLSLPESEDMTDDPEAADIEPESTVEEQISEEEEEILDNQQEIERVLSVGDYGSDVEEMQQWLADLGYLASYAVDGDFGPVTQNAVKLFQMYHGLPVTGIADQATQTMMESGTAFSGLEIGSYGTAVSGMQALLYQLGFLDIAPDGDYGPYTAQSVENFQKANGLYVDGEAGPQTLNALVGSPAANVPVDESSTDGEVSLGDYGPEVVEIQEQLIALGYLPSIADGDFGYVTKAAVIAFQAAAGLGSPDGSVGPYTRELLKNATAYIPMGNGSYGNDVQVMQNKLIDLGFLASYAGDGDFGGMTERALKRFQLYNGLGITGVADINTLNILYRSEEGFYELSVGSDGTAAYGVQQILVQLGFLDVAPDGDYGWVTANAVKAFQKANDLYVDGEAGSYTLDVLLNNPVTYLQYKDNQTVEYGGTYLISSALGRVLDVYDASVESGANVQLNDSGLTGNQKWVMQSEGDDLYYIRNLRSWKVLDLVDGNVQQSEASGDASQMWKIIKAEDGGYYVVNTNGMYLDLEGDSAENGTNICASLPDHGAGQRWYMEEVDSETALDFKTDGTQYIGIRTFDLYKGNVTETSGYYNIETDIDLPSGGYYLSGGDNYSIGLKVMYVNSFLAQAGYLNWGYYNYNRYDGNTVWAVRQFQSDYGLYEDGIVGLQTWLAMGYSEYDWYNLGAYTTDLKVYAYGSDRSTYVNAMLQTAGEYAAAGTGFSDGASGRPGTYVDCSGLIFQCLYAAGINPDVNIIDHARVVYEYTSANLGYDWQMGVAVSYAQPGDLIFYGGNSINHVAIYAGNGMIYDSWPGQGVTYRNMYSGGNILKIVRVF